MDEYPRLSMFGKFERWVVSGRKTMTIRYQRQLPMGVTEQVMQLPGGTLVSVSCGHGAIFWPAQSDQRKAEIANREGFESVAAFEHELENLKLYGRAWMLDFLTGKRPAFAHELHHLDKEQRNGR